MTLFSNIEPLNDRNTRIIVGQQKNKKIKFTGRTTSKLL